MAHNGAVGQAGRGGGAGRAGGQQPAKLRKRKERDAPEDEPARPWQPLNEQEVQDGIRCPPLNAPDC